MDAAAKRTFYTAQLVTFLALATAAFLALLLPQWIRTDAGAWIIGVVAFVFVAMLLVLTSIASFGDTVPGNTFSELLRESTLNTAFYPWALSVYMGRWFHPVDGLDSPFGVWGSVLLMVLTWGVVVAGDLVRRKGGRIWPWLIVVAGYGVGALTWPA